MENKICKLIVYLTLISSLLASSLVNFPDIIRSLCNYSLMFLFIVYVVVCLYRKKYVKRNDKYIKVIIFFMLSYLLTIIMNIYIVDNAKNFVMTAIHLFVVFYAIRNDVIKMENISNIFTLVVFLINAISFVYYLIGLNINSFDNRFCGLYSNPNIGSIVVVLSIMLSVIHFRKQNKILKSIYILNILFGIALVNAMGSRSGQIVILAFVFLFVCVLLYKKYNTKKYILFSILTIVFSLSVSCVFANFTKNVRNTVLESTIFENMNQNEGIDDQVNEERSEENKNASTKMRLLLIENGIKTGIKHPVFGVGEKGVALYVQEETSTYLIGLQGGGLHNIYVQLFVSNGFLGLLSFLTIIFFVLKDFLVNFNNKDDVHKGYFVLILCLLGYGMFEANLIISSCVMPVIFWSLLGEVSKNE